MQEWTAAMNGINLTLFRHAVALTHRAFADIPEELMRQQPIPGMNPPVWILGHCLFSLDSVLKLLGRPTVCPPEYSRVFGPGSKLEAMPGELPTRKEMLVKLGQVSEMILAEVPKVAPEHLAKANPNNFYKAELPTIGDIVENLMYSHLMLHVGQVTVWRKAHSLQPIVAVPGS